MLQVYHSNQVERLVDQLAVNVAAMRGGIFEKVHVVVPNWNLETYLKFQIAARQGIAAHFEFHVLVNFLAEILPKAVRGEVQILDETLIHKLIVDLLSDEVWLAGKEVEAVRAYLEASKGRDGSDANPDALDRRRFQLAGQLAKLFREYDFSRREMLRTWPEKIFLDVEPFKQVEVWQRNIWLAIFGAGGKLEALAREKGKNFKRLTEVYDGVSVEDLNLPPQVHLFGFSYLARSFEPIIHKLGMSGSQVCLYSLNPCQEYWEDLQTGADDDEDAIASMRAGESLLKPEIDTPALRFWGRPGRDCHRMLSRLSDYAQVDLFEDVPGESLLQAVQRDILTRAPQRPQAPKEASFADESVRFYACPSVGREVETIAQEIWELVRADDRLRFNDIAVIVNNASKDAYQTQIRAVFNEIGRIPHHIVDLAGTAHSRVFEAVDLLFSLPFGQFRRREFLQLITHPNVLAKFPEIDPGQWLHWCHELHIVHGADHADHEGTYIESDLLNWQQGMRRLVLGAFMTDAERCEEPRPFVVGPAAYLPHEHAQTELQASARLNLLVQSLVADARFLKTERLSLTKWAAIMGEMIRVYLEPDEDRDAFEIMKCHELLGRLAERDLSEEPLSFRMAWEFARAELEALDNKRGQYLADGVVVSSFLPMRPIPFKVVFITGMGEGKFPATERVNPLDLRQVKWKEGDVRHREQEKYMFLETLISTRERLYLSWVSRNGRTGEPLEPSSVVRELQYILQGFEGAQALAARIYEPPLRRHESPGLLTDPEQPSPFIVHREAFEEARLKAMSEDLRAHCGAKSLPFPGLEALRGSRDKSFKELLATPLRLHRVVPRGEGEGSPKRRWSLSFWHLRRFLECPLQATAGLLVGLSEGDEEDLFAIENEIFETSPWHRSRLLKEVFTKSLTQGLPGAQELASAYQNRARLLELQGILPTGIFKETERMRHLGVLNHWRENLEFFELQEAFPLKTRRFGRSSQTSQTTERLDSIRLEIELPGEEFVEVEIHGESQPMSVDGTLSTTLLPRPNLREKDYLPGFFDHVFLAASGAGSGDADAARSWRIFANTAQELRYKKRDAEKAMRFLPPMSEALARDYLKTLVTAMLGQVHDYILPIEAVVAFIKNDFQDMEQTIDEVLGGRAMSSSEYGPVRRLHDFGPLGDIEARRIIETRYGPLIELLGGR